jgi:hypothetical protein
MIDTVTRTMDRAVLVLFDCSVSAVCKACNKSFILFNDPLRRLKFKGGGPLSVPLHTCPSK